MLKTYWWFRSFTTDEYDGENWLLETEKEVLTCVEQALLQGQAFSAAQKQMTEEEFEKVPEM